MRSSNQNWPTVRAMNLEDLRGDSPDHADDSNLGDGADDGGFDPNDYECVDSPSSTTASLLPPHVKAACIAYHYEQQEQQCYMSCAARYLLNTVFKFEFLIVQGSYARRV